jgi:hypothetical protein
MTVWEKFNLIQTEVLLKLLVGRFHPFLLATKALRENRVIALLCV